MAAIEAENLRRTYRTTSGFLHRRSLEIEAVRGIDLVQKRRIPELCELVGLIGGEKIGLDPVDARKLRSTIVEFTRTGKTVLSSTHYRHEAEGRRRAMLEYV